MHNFLTRSAPGLLVVCATAALGYAVLLPPGAPAALASASEIAEHNAQCTVCRLPLYGTPDKSSKNGNDSVGHHTAVESTR
jgi:hypothetical protein